LLEVALVVAMLILLEAVAVVVEVIELEQHL
jgi:hypothetical protein